MRDFFFEVATRYFFAFKLVFAPKSEEIEPALLGMSLTTLGEVRVPRPVSLFESRICDIFGIAHFPIFLLEIKS